LCKISALWEAYMRLQKVLISPNDPDHVGVAGGVVKIKVSYNQVLLIIILIYTVTQKKGHFYFC